METEPHAGYSTLEQARERWPGTLIGNGGFSEEFDVAGADALVAAGKLDLVAIGRAFLANPDLPTRLRAGAPLTAPDQATFYGGGAEGYTDYPVWNPADPAGSVLGPKEHDDADALLLQLNI